MLLKFLTQSYPTDKNVFLIPRFALRIAGFYPGDGNSRRMQAWLIFNFVVLVYGSYAEFMFGIHYLSIDVVRALDALCPVASSIMSVVKLAFLWWHREELDRLIKRVTELIAAQNSRLKLADKRRYFTIATRLSASVLFFGTTTSTLYTIRAGIVNYLSHLRGEEIPYETPFKMIFPEPLLSMPIFPLTFIFSHWHGYITVAGFAGTDGLFLCFCMYIGTMLKALQYDTKDLLSDVGCGESEHSSEVEIKRSLKMIIVRHNEIIDLVKRFSAVMSGITLGHFVTSSAIIGTCVVDMLLFSDYGVLVYLVHTMAVSTELFLYCLGGTVVIECSSQLATAVYASNWYTHTADVQRMVLLIIIRSQRSLVLKVPFFAPSLPALTSILRFTGSLIALAKSVI
ncbi:PREDICTED: odorant receptor 24a [Bactrocera latifrons]|uniref:odorant receptor 24a n=1 Tax=Bactrocera latifrons TaxID=174628 RepID=UPI0008DDEA21|nr:PREDICTED: odorant receptor 24a [Bactrocera latifrons]